MNLQEKGGAAAGGEEQRSCPTCSSGDVRSYQVLSEGGWYDVVKCRSCLHSVSRQAAPSRLGPISLTSDGLVLE
jgi:vanillate/4-hydroxybenzoate decarboxylase subunit D